MILSIKDVLNMIDKFSEIVMLIDFYGGLLTEKQLMIMSYHFEQDMSLSEISEELNISRQAVHDIIKRSEKALRQYENELGLMKRFVKQREEMVKIRSLLTDKNIRCENIDAAVELINQLIDM